MEKTQETAPMDFGDELQKIYKVQPRLPRLHLIYIYNNVSFLVNQYHEILACAPEELRVGDAKHILLVGITLQGVAG